MAWEWVSPVCTAAAAVVSTAAVVWTAQQARGHAERVAEQTALAAADQSARERSAQRKSEEVDHFRTATAELEARFDLVRDLYEALWWALDRSDGGWNSSAAADFYHQQATEAWIEYQRARAAVRKIAPEDVDLAYGTVREALESMWVVLGTWYYTGTPPTADVEAIFVRFRRAKEDAEALAKGHMSAMTSRSAA